MVTIKQLAHARALGKHGNFHRAAKSVNLSQPAFSRSIASLESALGVTLFNRNAQTVTVTAYGEALLARGELVLAQADEIVREITLLRGLEAGSLSVAMGVYAAEMCANSAIAEMVNRYPNVSYQAKLAAWSDVRALVETGAVDLGVVEISTMRKLAHLHAESVGGHRMIFVCRAGHPLLGKKRLSKTDLAAYPLASIRLPPRAARFVPELGRLDNDTGELVPAIEIIDPTAAITIVSSSDAIGIAAPVEIEPLLAKGELAYLPYNPAWLKLDYGVVYLKNRMLSPVAEQYIEVLRQIDAERGRRNTELLQQFTG